MPASTDVSVTGNPVWMHVSKLGKFVDDIAEHVVEKRVCLGILIEHSTVQGSNVRQGRALLVMKEAT